MKDGTSTMSLIIFTRYENDAKPSRGSLEHRQKIRPYIGSEKGARCFVFFVPKQSGAKSWLCIIKVNITVRKHEW